MANTMVISYPESLPDVLRMTREEFESEARLLLAAQLYEGERLTADQAAEIAGLGKKNFLEKAATLALRTSKPTPNGTTGFPAKKQYALDDILDSFPTAEDYPEVDFGKPQGEEVW